MIENVNNLSPVEKLHQIEKELNNNFIEREDVIRLLLLCWVGKLNLLVTGKPGTAKTAMANAAAKHIDSGNYFEVLLNKFSDPGEVFGAWDFAEMQKGNQVRNLSWGIVPAHTAVVDEVGKASTAILNVLLPVMNERVYHERGQHVHSNLFTIVGCSNELPNSPELSALFDRFHVRYNVERLSKAGASQFRKQYNRTKYTAKTTITLDEIKQLQDLIPEQPASMIPDSVFDSLDKLWEKMGEEGFESSDRRWGIALIMLCASAIYNGRTQVNDDDIEVLSHIFWEDPKDLAKVKAIISQIGDPLKAKAGELYDTGITLYQAFSKKFAGVKGATVITEAASVMSALKELIEEANEIASNNPGANTKRLEDTVTKLTALKDELVYKYL